MAATARRCDLTRHGPCMQEGHALLEIQVCIWVVALAVLGAALATSTALRLENRLQWRQSALYAAQTITASISAGKTFDHAHWQRWTTARLPGGWAALEPVGDGFARVLVGWRDTAASYPGTCGPSARGAVSCVRLPVPWP